MIFVTEKKGNIMRYFKRVSVLLLIVCISMALFGCGNSAQEKHREELNEAQEEYNDAVDDLEKKQQEYDDLQRDLDNLQREYDALDNAK